MTIKVTYNVTDIYVSESVSATYINVSYEAPSGGGGAVWGDIIGTLSDQADLQAALDAKVPYTGATANVDLGEFELKAGQIEYDQTPTGVAGVAVTRWNDSTGTIETTLKGGSVVLEHGRDMFERIVNKTGIQLTKAAYQAVRVSNAQGQRLAVQLAQANNDNNSADTIGLVVETIDNNQEGYIYTVGEIDGVNTTGTLQGETWVDGDVLYLSPTTAGRITNVKPIAPQHLVVIGYVIYAHQNNGKIYVKVMNGWELGELHDVDTTGAVAGNVLKYNGTIWTPSGDVGITSLNGLNATTQTFATGTSGTDFNISSATSTHTFNLPSASATNRGLLTSADWTTFNNKQNSLTNPVTGTGVAGQVAYWSGTGTQTGSNNFLWDNANVRLQISNAGVNGFYANNAINWASTTNYTLQRQGGVVGIRINNTDNVSIGATTDGGQKFQVYGDTLLKGSGNTSATTALTVQDSGGVGIYSFRNDGQLIGIIRNAQTEASIRFTQVTANNNNFVYVPLIAYENSGATQRGVLSGAYGGTGQAFFRFSHGQQTNGIEISLNRPSFDNNTGNTLNINQGFAPTSGANTWSQLLIGSTINQTGGASGITRGLYVNPNLTAAADWRSIEWSNNTGWGLYGAGTSNNFLAGRLQIGSAAAISYVNLYVSRNITGGNSSYAVVQDGVVQSDVISTATGYYNGLSTVNSTFTLVNYVHYDAQQGTIGASSTVTNQYGFRAASSLIGATNDYGFYGDIPSGNGRWNLYMNGTANNYLNGNLGMGVTPSAWTTGSSIKVIQFASGSVYNFSNQRIYIAQNFYYDGTNNIYNTTAAASLIEQALGYHAWWTAPSGTAGTIATLTERMRLNNVGNLLINSTTDSGERLQVTGTMKVTGASTFGGNVTIPIGSYDAPSLSFASDSNTGMFSPLADNLEIKTGTHNAVILENQGVNLMPNSENLGTFPTNFQQISVSIPGNIVAPDGTTTANIAVPDTSLNQHRFYRGYTIGGPNTSSVYAKSAGYNFISLASTGGTAGETIIFDIVNGTISGTSSTHTASIENVGNGWFRCSLTSTNVVVPTAYSRWIIVRNANSTASYSGDGTSGVYLWGWQIEEGTASTSYIRTGATGVTRPQSVTVLGQNLYGNLTTRKVGAPSLNDFALTTDYTDRLVVKAATGNVIVSSSLTAASYNLSALNTAPATAASTGTLGEIRIDANYIYICTATNTWKRVAIATW